MPNKIARSLEKEMVNVFSLVYSTVFSESLAASSLEKFEKMFFTSDQLTRRERLKSALYLRLKKRKRLFFGKKLEIFRKCRIATKNVKVGPFGLY